jgi:hypothetical protein
MPQEEKNVAKVAMKATQARKYVVSILTKSCTFSAVLALAQNVTERSRKGIESTKITATKNRHA